MTIPPRSGIACLDDLIMATIEEQAPWDPCYIGMVDFWRDVTSHPDYPEYWKVTYRTFQKHIKALHIAKRLVHVMCSRNDVRVYPKSRWDRMCGRAAEAR